MPGKQTGRSRFLDFVKGISIFLVLWGHAIQYLCVDSFDFFVDSVFKLLYSFHLPLLMLVSGYVFYWTCQNRTPRQAIAGRLKRLGAPMLSWALIGFMWSLRSAQGVPLSELALWLVWSLFNTTWFLWAVLLASVVTAAAYFRKTGGRIACVLIGFVLTAFLPDAQRNLYLLPYFLAGFALNATGVAEWKHCRKTVIAVSAALWAGMLLFYQKKHYIYVSGILPGQSEYGFWAQTGIDLYRYAIGWFGCVTVLAVLRFAYDKLLRFPIVTGIEQWGRESLKIYVLQTFFVERLVATVFRKSVEICGVNYLTGNRFVFDFIVTPACAVLASVVLLRLAHWIEMCGPLGFALFGKHARRD